MASARRLIVCADDFGLDLAVNEAVEAAHRDGILTCTSLMVGAPAAADAAERAKRMPTLAVGLHLTLVDGRPVLPRDQIPDLVDAQGAFDNRMALQGARFFFLPNVRRQLSAEIRAQFEAFRATGLPLDHVNAHKHFHIHPTIARLAIEIGRDYGIKAMRVPAEPTAVLRQAAAAEGLAIRAPLYAPWIELLRRKIKRAGLAVNDHMLGLAWTGGMTEARVLRMIDALPEGVSELYSHPAVTQSQALKRAMPSYRPMDEQAALVSPAVRERIAERGIDLIAYRDLVS